MPRRGTTKIKPGDRFGTISVLRQAGWKIRADGIRRTPLWDCRCDCGKEITRSSQGLGSWSKSCGCLGIIALMERSTKHGASRRGRRTPAYSSWREMMVRCTNERRKDYPYYGGRGIRICDRWLDFSNFLADMGERPDGMTLDRKDSNGNYEPENCRWASRLEQSRNTRAVKLNPDLVNEILGRIEHGESITSVAKRMSVSSPVVAGIRDGKIWAGVVAPFAGYPVGVKQRYRRNMAP